MRKCPKCKQWTLEFDDYFGRYRCFNPDCEWMPPSAAEREIRLLEERKEPQSVWSEHIPELGTTVVVKYDSVNDALSFNFGVNDITFDLPESDGRMLWKVSRNSNTIVGFDILEAKRFGISEVRVNIVARKEDIERNLRKIKGAFSSGRPTRLLVASVAVKREGDAPDLRNGPLRKAVAEFQRTFC
jgi:hypothetical protein